MASSRTCTWTVALPRFEGKEFFSAEKCGAPAAKGTLCAEHHAEMERPAWKTITISEKEDVR